MDRETRHKIKHDKFVDDVGKTYTYVRSHSRPVLWTIVGAIAVIALLAGFIVYQRAEEGKAQKRLAEGIEIMDAPIVTAIDDTTPGPKFRSDQEKIQKAQPIFEEVLKNHSGTHAADIADLYLARFAAERGDVAAARPKLEKFVREHSDHILAGAAQRGLYELRMGAGETKQVIGELEAELNNDEGPLPNDVVLALLAQAHERAGDSAKAREAYQRIVNEFPDSPYTTDAQRKLAQG